MFPHHKAGRQAHQATDQVQNHLDEEEQFESASDAGTVRHIPVHEGPAEGLRGGQSALAGVEGGSAGKLCELGIVVSGERHGQHADRQAKGTQDKVRELQESRRKASQLQRVLDDYRQSQYRRLLLSWEAPPLSSESWCPRRDSDSLWAESEPSWKSDGLFICRTDGGCFHESSQQFELDLGMFVCGCSRQLR